MPFADKKGRFIPMKRILFHKYEILKLIAEGGMGRVFLARDLHLNKMTAVKICKNPENQEEKAAVTKEVEVLKQLTHKGLPAIIDFFEEGEELCMVMEYVEGITLEQYLEKFKKAEIEQAVKWTLELTEILGYLHSRRPSIIYRDLKPANIVIQSDGSIKLIDFGAAFITAYGANREQLCIGTPGYSAPEQWQAIRVGKECDVYGVGALLHEMLTGVNPAKPPFERRALREYDRKLPIGLEKIILTCTGKRTFERYQTMEQLQRDLKNYKKEDRVRGYLFQIGKLTGKILWLSAAAVMLLPFLRGVPEESLPLPYLYKPALFFGLAWLYRGIFLKTSYRKNVVRKQEKSILLTEKKFAGLYFFLLTGVLWAGLLSMERGTISSAEEKKENLWVEMRDSKNRKLLLKEGAVFQAEETVRLELPAERIPEGRFALQLIASGEEGETYISRIFLIEKKEN